MRLYLQIDGMMKRWPTSQWWEGKQRAMDSSGGTFQRATTFQRKNHIDIKHIKRR